MTPQRWAHGAAVAGHLGLIALLLAWFTVIAPPAERGYVAPLLVLLTGPLALGLRGILHGRRYTCAWTSLLSLGYFIHGAAVYAGDGAHRWLGAVEAVLSLLLFTGCVVYVRLSRPAQAQ